MTAARWVSGILLVMLAGAAAAEATPVPVPLTFDYRVGGGGGGRDRGDDELRIVRREHTGRAIGLQVLTGVLAGGVGGIGFGKRQLHGERIEELPNPGKGGLQTALQQAMDGWAVEHPQAIPEPQLFVHISAGDWALIYQKLSDEASPYELRYQTTVSLTVPVEGKRKRHKVVGTMECSPTPVSLPYSEWVESDYAGLRSVSEKYVAECAGLFSNNLQAWLAEVPKREVVATVAEPVLEPVPEPAIGEGGPAAPEVSQAPVQAAEPVGTHEQATGEAVPEAQPR